MPYRLSKSKIVSGRQCVKRLYLEIHQPQLAEELASTEQVQWWGDQVHKVARDLNQGGILIGHDHDLSQALAQTQEALKQTDSSPLFEATFEYRRSFDPVGSPVSRSRTSSFSGSESSNWVKGLSFGGLLQSRRG